MTQAASALRPQDFGIGQLFWRIHEAVIVGDADSGRIVLWNPAAEALFGYPAPEMVGRRIEILIPEDLRVAHRTGLARFAATGHGAAIDADAALELPAVHKSGRALTIELTLSAIEEPPVDGRFVLAIIRDATARKLAEEQRVQLAGERAARAGAEAAQRRLAFLSEAGKQLARSLDYEATLHRIIELALPMLGDFGVLDVVEADGRVRRIAHAHADPRSQAVLAATNWVRSERTDVNLCALSSGSPAIHPIVDDAWMVEAAASPEHLTLMRSLAFRSMLTVPLLSRGERLGALTLFFAESGRHYTEADMILGEELAQRAAAAVENARLFAHAQEAIRVREEVIGLTKTLTDNATLALLMMDDRQRCTFMNPAAEQMTGHTLLEVLELDRPLHEIIHHTRPDGTHYPLSACPIDRALPQKHQERGEDVFVHKDGRFYPVAFTASPIVRDGRPVGTIIEVRDITAERQADAERADLLARERAAREQAEAAVRARDDFLSIAAHELKTPITSVRGFAQLLLRRLERGRELDVAAVCAGLGQVDRQAGKLAGLVSQLLDISRIEAGRLRLDARRTDLAALVADATAAAQARTDAHTITVRHPSEVWAEVDPTRLEQVLTNLLDNAIKYSPNGGPIDVELEHPDPETIRIAVADRGLGISPELRDRIFDRFYQAHAAEYMSGMGLGLYISRQIVELHGGQLHAEFPDGGGSRFIAELPTRHASSTGGVRAAD